MFLGSTTMKSVYPQEKECFGKRWEPGKDYGECQAQGIHSYPAWPGHGLARWSSPIQHSNLLIVSASGYIYISISISISMCVCVRVCIVYMMYVCLVCMPIKEVLRHCGSFVIFIRQTYYFEILCALFVWLLLGFHVPTYFNVFSCVGRALCK